MQILPTMKKNYLIACHSFLLILFIGFQTQAQYRVDFNEGYNGFWPDNLPGWTTRTGDGNIIFRQKFEDGSAVLNVDARNDKRNIWYAFMHQSISDIIDTEKLALPEFELRMEARVKPSHAPRRINMYLSSLDAGGFLREFDLDEANEWHTISMVTSGFTFDPDKPLMAQVSLMDWGVSDIFELHVDYIQVDLVHVDEEHIQYGLPLGFHPPILDASAFKEEVVAKTNLIDISFPEEVLKPWISPIGDDPVSLLEVDQTKIILLHWDLEKFKGRLADGEGQVELSTHSLFLRKDSPKDFGMIRFCEIQNYDENWMNSSSTYNDFVKSGDLSELIVSQCIYDVSVNPEKEGKTIVTISQPVMQRLINGETTGIAILPLGLISATFYDENTIILAPKLRFNTQEAIKEPKN